ncbi:MAG: hypothetical protein QNJ55_15795 [Xenococcus sp. MO_188.B8]|nr:hypothetical protein [Xenococcus sp. MO_188.B8]
MFGKSSRETSKSEISATPEVESSTNLNVDNDFSPNISFPESLPETSTSASSEVVNSELVNTVEKISRIVSPYFIVVVGLSLYDDNFLIGGILIVVGILSLFKVSLQDLTNLFNQVKKFLGFGDN